jgi:hypothetical protein
MMKPVTTLITNALEVQLGTSACNLATGLLSTRKVYLLKFTYFNEFLFINV